MLPVIGLLATGCVGKVQTVSGGGENDLSPLSAWIGRSVQVQLRRDVLGAAAAVPISPEAGSINGASVSIVGKLLEVTPSGLLIESTLVVGGKLSTRGVWAPHDSILLVAEADWSDASSK